MGLIDWFVKPFINLHEANRQERNVDNVAILEEALDKLNTTASTPKELITNSSLTTNNKNSFRPLTFDQYIGQDKAKNILKTLIEGNKKLGRIFPHTIISGRAGCGKTSLVKILARELGVSFTEIISSTIKEPDDLYRIIYHANGGIIFLDECHALKRDLVEPLYPIMEDFKIGNETVPEFTLIGATTELGEIIETRRPFYDRFKRPIVLEDYTTENIEAIVRQYYTKIFANEKLPDYIFTVIASNARLTPRIAIRLTESTVFMGGNIKMALDSEGIILDGYNDLDLKVLEILSDTPRGIGIQALASRLETSKKNFEFEIQPYLLKNEILQVSPRGRVITEKGKELMKRMREIKNNA